MASSGKVKKNANYSSLVEYFRYRGTGKHRGEILTETQRPEDGAYWCATVCIGSPSHKVVMGAQAIPHPVY